MPSTSSPARMALVLLACSTFLPSAFATGSYGKVYIGIVGGDSPNKPLAGRGNCGIATGIFGAYTDVVVSSNGGEAVTQDAVFAPNPGSPNSPLFFEAAFGEQGTDNDGITGYVCAVKLKQDTKGHVEYECASNFNFNSDGTPNFEIIDLEIDFAVTRSCAVKTRGSKPSYTRSGEVLGPTRDVVDVFVSAGEKNR